MAILKGNISECKKHIKRILKKVSEGKYKIDYVLTKVGTEETKPVKDETGTLVCNYKRTFQDVFTISYIDEEAKKHDKSNS